MQLKRGLFIVFEGIDGCGKSTHARALLKHLFQKTKYEHVVLTREPFRSRGIRKILSQEKNPYSQAQKLTQLFIKDRIEHLNKVVIPNLNLGTHVVSDRYKYSTMAYQAAQGISMGKLIKMHPVVRFPTPDLTYIIDVSIKVALQRIEKDKEGRTKEQKFEDDSKFLEKVRQNYLLLPKLLPSGKIFIVNGEQDIENTTKDIIKIFEQKFSYVFDEGDK